MKNKKPKGNTTVDISLDSIGKNKLDMFNDFYNTLQKYSIEKGNVGIQIPITKIDQNKIHMPVIEEETKVEEDLFKEYEDYFENDVENVNENDVENDDGNGGED